MIRAALILTHTTRWAKFQAPDIATFPTKSSDMITGNSFHEPSIIKWKILFIAIRVRVGMRGTHASCPWLSSNDGDKRMMARMRVTGAYITCVVISGRCFLCLAYYTGSRSQSTPMQHAVVESKHPSRSIYDLHSHFVLHAQVRAFCQPTPKPANSD
ncbi:hypothetical protein EV401DRAFT_429948 [Pisolithus croceorrhizus]|nr:hypothetical protein EV401DRAFT_429948 [Pisolithus croceorrhizus]